MLNRIDSTEKNLILNFKVINDLGNDDIEYEKIKFLKSFKSTKIS